MAGWNIVDLSLAGDVVGVLGVAVVTLMYLLLQTGRIAADRMLFSAANALGSVLILASLSVHWNLPSVVMEGVWLSVSGYGAVKALRSRRPATAR